MFILANNKVTIEPKALLISEFEALWTRDHTKGKERANKEFSYIYFVGDFNSEYNIYGIAKEQVVKEEVMGKKNYRPDKFVNEALTKYIAIQNTSSMRFLKSARGLVDTMIDFYDKERKKIGKKHGEVMYKPEQLLKPLKELDDIMETLDKWEKKVRGEEDDMQIRGGGRVGTFEDAKSATWLNR